MAGGQTARQTGGWAARLFRCLTRWAWRSIPHLQRFQRRYQREAAKQRAPEARRNPNSHENIASNSGGVVFRVPRCSKGSLRLPGLPPKLTFTPCPQYHTCVFKFRPTWVTKWHFMLPQHLWRPKRQSKFAQDVISRCIQTNTGRVYVMHLFKHDLRNEQIDHSLGFFALQTHLLWIKIWRYAKVIKVN